MNTNAKTGNIIKIDLPLLYINKNEISRLKNERKYI